MDADVSETTGSEEEEEMLSLLLLLLVLLLLPVFLSGEEDVPMECVVTEDSCDKRMVADDDGCGDSLLLWWTFCNDDGRFTIVTGELV